MQGRPVVDGRQLTYLQATLLAHDVGILQQDTVGAVAIDKNVIVQTLVNGRHNDGTLADDHQGATLGYVSFEVALVVGCHYIAGLQRRILALLHRLPTVFSSLMPGIIGIVEHIDGHTQRHTFLLTFETTHLTHHVSRDVNHLCRDCRQRKQQQEEGDCQSLSHCSI